MPFLVVVLAGFAASTTTRKICSGGGLCAPPEPNQKTGRERGVDVSEQRDPPEAEAHEPASKNRDQDAAPAQSHAASARPIGRLGQLRQELSTGLRELQWRDVLLFGVLSGVLMSLSFLQGSALSIIA